jgi:integrase
MAKRTSTGIRERHARTCTAPNGGRCSCTPAVEAWVWSRRDERKIRKTFTGNGALAAAKGWRAAATVGLARGTMRAPSATTLRQAAVAWLAGAKDGSVRTRSGDRYKPSATRGYEQALRDRLLPELGGAKLSDIRRADVQDFADRLLAAGLDPSTIRNALMPLRAIYRRAVSRGDVAVNPTTGLELPAVRGRRDRIASPSEAADLLAALPEATRPLWATALYAGLRRGELMALRWEDVDLAEGVIRVERSWDVKAGVIEPKSRAGVRQVPIPAVLRDYLIAHKLRSGRSAGLVFGRTAEKPFDSTNARRRAESAWRRIRRERALELAHREGREVDTLDELTDDDQRRLLEEAGVVPIGLHECRHTFASLMIAAGVNAKALSTYMGHSSITITLDRYGHLFPGNEDEAAELLDAYLERSNTQARLAQVT